ncbi:MAG: cupin domain-containing protein [Oscillospiraceae bacterium]
MEFIKCGLIQSLQSEGVISRQLLNLDNSMSERVTITEVHLEPGFSQPRHKHDTSEQIWYAVKGKGALLLADDKEQEFNIGDVVRFVDGDIHGLLNDSNEEFVYVSITSPPINFKYAYNK